MPSVWSIASLAKRNGLVRCLRWAPKFQNIETHPSEKCSITPIELHAARANLSGANLTAIRAEKVRFDFANLKQVRLDDAVLRNATLNDSDLTGAFVRRADLTHALLTGAKIDDSDFTDANLSEARLMGLRLSVATGHRGADPERP